mgnify:CR=1 FL=1
MPGGRNNIKPQDGKQFSSTYQPKQYRTSAKFLTELIIKNLDKKKEIILTGIDIETGEKRKFRVENPTKDILVMALLRKAANGDIQAIREVLDRVEGKPVFTAEVDLPGIQYIGFKGE